MYVFVRNNIQYRLIASKAIEGYYRSKAFILNELISPQNNFGSSAREIMLLLFNIHSESLVVIENTLLESHTVGAAESSAIHSEINRRFREVGRVFDQHMDVFDNNFIRPWLKIHKQVHMGFYEQLKCLAGMDRDLAFPYVTECIRIYLNAILFELYELDCLLGSTLVKRTVSTNNSNPDTLILFVDDLTKEYGEISKIDPEMERLKYYVTNLIESGKVFNVSIRDFRASITEDDSYCTKLQEALMVKPYIKEVNIVRSSYSSN